MNLLTLKEEILLVRMEIFNVLKKILGISISSFLQFGFIIFLIHFDNQDQPVLLNCCEKSLRGWKANISISLF